MSVVIFANLVYAGLMAGITAVFAIMVEVLMRTSDKQWRAGGFFRRNYNQIDGAGWSRIVAAILVVGVGYFVVHEFADVEWANWVTLGASVVLIVYQVLASIKWISRIREAVVLGILLLIEYSIGDGAFRNVLAANAEAAMFSPLMMWGEFAALVAIAGFTAYRLWIEKQWNNQQAGRRKPSGFGPVAATAATAVAAIALVAGISGANPFAFGSQSDTQPLVTPFETVAEADEGGEISQAAVQINNATDGVQFDLGENLKGTPKEFWIVDNEVNVPLKGVQFENVTLDESLPASPPAAVGIALDLDRQSSGDPNQTLGTAEQTAGTMYIRSGYRTFLPDGKATTNAEMAAELTDYFYTHTADYLSWLNGLKGILRSNSFDDWTDATVSVQTMTALNRYAFPLPQLIILQNAEPLTLDVAIIHGNIKGQEINIVLIKRCLQIGNADLGLPIYSESQVQEMSVTTSTAAYVTPTTPSTPGETPSDDKPPVTPPEPNPPVPPNPPEDDPYVKNPEDSSNQGHNDTDGPGPDTNNGVGAEHSAADQNQSNSGYMDDMDQYDNNMDQIHDANEKHEQQEESGNAPSYDPYDENSGWIPPTGSDGQPDYSEPAQDNNNEYVDTPAEDKPVEDEYQDSPQWETVAPPPDA